MSLTAENELTIRAAVHAKCAAAEGIGDVLPSPIFFVDKADFFAAAAPQITKKAIETTVVNFCLITLLRFEDENPVVEGCEDQPLVSLTYNLYLFRQYDFERVDETSVPDAFNKKLLKAERDFLKTFFGLRNIFLGNQTLEGLPANFAVSGNSAAQSEFLGVAAECRYIPDIIGFSADLQTKIEVRISE